MDNRQNPTNINWYPGHMAKTKREIKEKLSLIDIVLEVVDARAPLSSKIMDIEETIKTKPRILIMTKYDLCDKVETDKIMEYYKKEGYSVVGVDLISGKGVKEILTISEKYRKEENEKRQQKGLKEKSLRALVIGIPNVGKSTLINRLVGKKATTTGNRPGVTKSLGWIRINKNLELLDTPGILWPKFEDQEQAKILALLSSIKEEILNKEDLAIFALQKLSFLYQDRVIKRYGTSYQEDIVKVFDQIAKKRGCITKGGKIDYDRVYNILLQDVKNASFGPITLDRI